MHIFFFIPPGPPSSTLFPYTTLFRSYSPSRRSIELHSPYNEFRVGRMGLLYERFLAAAIRAGVRSEEHTSELQSQSNLVCRLLLEKKKQLLPTLRSPNFVIHECTSTK